MNILIVNDDGIDAPGIRVLTEAAKQFGEVSVVAPESQCSAMSHRITVAAPMRFSEREWPGVRRAVALEGTPADCVKAAKDVFMDARPELVLSGINHGYNVGFDIAYSGTIGAAMEALMLGIPAMAFSQDDLCDFTLSSEYITEVMKSLIGRPIEKNAIWNVNFPGCRPDEVRGLQWDVFPAREEYYKGTLENHGRTVSYPPLDSFLRSPGRGEAGSDLNAVTTNYIAIGKVYSNLL